MSSSAMSAKREKAARESSASFAGGADETSALPASGRNSQTEPVPRGAAGSSPATSQAGLSGRPCTRRLCKDFVASVVRVTTVFAGALIFVRP